MYGFIHFYSTIFKRRNNANEVEGIEKIKTSCQDIVIYYYSSNCHYYFHFYKYYNYHCLYWWLFLLWFLNVFLLCYVIFEWVRHSWSSTSFSLVFYRLVGISFEISFTALKQFTGWWAWVAEKEREKERERNVDFQGTIKDVVDFFHERKTTDFFLENSSKSKIYVQQQDQDKKSN